MLATTTLDPSPPAADNDPARALLDEVLACWDMARSGQDFPWARWTACQQQIRTFLATPAPAPMAPPTPAPPPAPPRPRLSSGPPGPAGVRAPGFGARLRLLREGHGWTLRDVQAGAALGSTSSLALVEQDNMTLSPQLRARLADLYRLHRDFLTPTAAPVAATLSIEGPPILVAAVLAFARRAGVVSAVTADAALAPPAEEGDAA